MEGKKIAFVVLNYMNYMDTCECVDSILQINYPFVGIVIVDNASTNGSVRYLHEKYKNHTKIRIIENSKNLGFAKGNNVGIAFARKRWKADFVMTVNNDIIFTDKDYVGKMLGAYQAGMGVMTSNVRMGNGKLRERSYQIFTPCGLLCEYIQRMCRYLRLFSISDYIAQHPPKGQKTMIINGCLLLFTPDFFRYYKGFYPGTFLYGEEIILELLCERYGLYIHKVTALEIFHKSARSTKMSGASLKQNQFMVQSYKYVIWNWMINEWNKKKGRTFETKWKAEEILGH